MAISIPTCRVCGSGDLEPVLSLGDMPAVNSFLPAVGDTSGERKHPLAIAFCRRCTHVQLTHRLDPHDIFEDYIYFSSMSETIVRWGRALADRYAGELELGREDLVVELASNDGCVLKPFGRRSRILGVEPARNVAEVAVRDGVPTRADFFDARLADELVETHGRARLIIARNVLAHVPDLVDFVAGAARLLADDGVFHVEVPYLMPMVQNLEFDTIYHEHLSYFSVAALQRLFAEAGLLLWDVEEIPLHGGSLIARGRKVDLPRASVARLIAQEREAGLLHGGPLHRFAEGTAHLRTALPEYLRRLSREGPIAAYGAAAKGVVLTNACGLGADLIPWVADKSPYKQGKRMPGTHALVVPPSQVFAEQPAHLVVLAWNFFSEITGQLIDYRQHGGRFVVPVPNPRVVAA